MFDLQVLGDKIVQEISSLIDENVIITDKNGFVISSKDPARLNTFHEGASISMKNQQELHMTKEMCEKLKGVRPGIVMPIIVSRTPIGVIGITGKLSEVEKYAKLVKKVAELFITDFMARQEKERGVRELEFFFFDLVTMDSTPEAIEDRARMINIDSSVYRRIAIMQTNYQFEITDVENLHHMQTIHPDVKIIRWGLEKLVLLLPDIPKQQLFEELDNLAAKIQKKTKNNVPGGIGKVVPFHRLRESFQQAETAAAVSVRRQQMIFEEDLKLELLYHSIPKEVQKDFLYRTISPLLAEEELLYNLEVWLKKKGSLQEVADELHIHKNTLTYRLAKIEALLGISLTDKKDIATIYTAVQLQKMN